MALQALNRKAFGCSAKAPARASRVMCHAHAGADATPSSSPSRRHLLQHAAALAAAATIASQPGAALAAGLPPQDIKMLCDADCTAQLEAVEAVTTPSGLVYKDIVVGNGPTPPIGFQVVCNYVAMTPNLRVFDSSVDKGRVYDVRVGAGQVIAGLDEGLQTMRPGGLRRLYIPGNLSFPKGLKAAAGRPSVPPSSPVVFDVQLLYIPGLEDE